MVIQLSESLNIPVDEEQIREYFFEELVDRDSEDFHPMDLKLHSVNYTEKTRDQLRKGL